MKNSKGQALVEFILVLPALILLLFGMIEIGNIIYQKYTLETHIDPLIELYNNEEELIEIYENKNDIKADFEKSGNLVNIKVTKNVKLITPGITKFLGNPFKVEVERTFYTG